MKLYVKIGTFENIFPTPGSKFQAVFSIEAGTPKFWPAAHLYHLLSYRGKTYLDLVVGDAE